MIGSKFSNGIIVVVGSGRSGTSFMVQILRKVYGIGTSAEPKDVLKLCKMIEKRDLNDSIQYDKALDACYRSGVLEHLREKKWKTSKKALAKHIEEKSVEGLIIGLFRYVAELRSRPINITIDFPGYKDPKDLLNMSELRYYLPNSWFINMVRRGEDVAHSKLKYYWGATNPVAGAFYWKRQMKKGLANKKLINAEQYLELKLEDLYDDFEGYCLSLDQFMNRACRRSNLPRLKEKLQYFIKPYAEYSHKGIKGRFVAYLVSNVNKELGYANTEYQPFNWWNSLLVSVFIILDIPLRGVNIVLRNTGKKIKPLSIG
jgi:hypothetical protein